MCPSRSRDKQFILFVSPRFEEQDAVHKHNKSFNVHIEPPATSPRDICGRIQYEYPVAMFN